MDLSHQEAVKTIFLLLILLTPILNSVTRVYFDQQLKDKFKSVFKCCFKQNYVDSEELRQDLTATMHSGGIEREINHGGSKIDNNENSVYEKLIQIETLNNLIASFTGICMLMHDIYDKYFHEKQNADVVDNLAYTKLTNEEMVKQKIVKEYTL